MRRRLPLKTKIRRCTYEALTKVNLPALIHHDAGHERIGSADQPTGELQSIRGLRLLRVTKHGRNPWQDTFPRRQEIAAQMNMRRSRLNQFLHHGYLHGSLLSDREFHIGPTLSKPFPRVFDLVEQREQSIVIHL